MTRTVNTAVVFGAAIAPPVIVGLATAGPVGAVAAVVLGNGALVGAYIAGTRHAKTPATTLNATQNALNVPTIHLNHNHNGTPITGR